MKKKIKVAIVGLGYVGLPLAIEFAKKRKIIGFDINKERISELLIGKDKTLEFEKKKIISSKKNIIFTSKINDLKKANCYIVTVPTPVTKTKKPDLTALLNASKTIGKVLKKGDIIVYESTVYPGCTEEDCVPILEKFSNLKFNVDFYCGYSPERINPGDQKHKINNIKKIVSASNPKILKILKELYSEIINAGIYMASSIKVAEAAKVIENTQRDINVALINELSIIFNKMEIDTREILNAAKTKWNFLPFYPGLVGGHCIGVDPYYLTYKAKKIKYVPKIILSGRKLNDNMGNYIGQELIKKMIKKKICFNNSKILIMGLTFKENCPDIRNSGVFNIIQKLKQFKCQLEIYDPYVDKNDLNKEYKNYLIKNLIPKRYNAIIIAVAHKKFKKFGFNNILNLCQENYIIYDLKHLFKGNKNTMRL